MLADVTLLRLVRHGETDENALRRIQGQRDVPLNERGRAQAVAAASELHGMSYAAIVTSPLMRAAETARIIAQQAGDIPLLFDADLMEQAWGAAEGVAWADLDRAFPDGQIPGRESITRLAVRVERVLKRIASDHAERNVIVVTHGGVINLVHRMARCDRAAAENGSISDVTVDPGGMDSPLSIVPAVISRTHAGWD